MPYAFGTSHKDSRQITASRKLIAKDLHWVAGFMEGEGSFTHCGTERTKASQKQREPLLLLQRILGGHIREYKNSWGFPMYEWYASGKRARGIMLTLYLLMSTKRKNQIKEAISSPLGIKLADLLKANV